MAKNRPGQTTSKRNSRDATALGQNLTQGELSTDGSGWRARFTANAYGRKFELSPPRPTELENRRGTSAEPHSADSESKE